MFRYRLRRRKGSPNFYLLSPEKDHRSKPIYISTGKSNFQEADIWAKEHLMKMENKAQGTNDETLEAAVVKWAEVAKTTNRSFKTSKYQLRNLLAFFGPKKKLMEISKHEVNLMINHLRERKNSRGNLLSEATINRYKALLKRVINYAIEIGDYNLAKDKNPVAMIKNKPEESRKEFFVAEQIALISDKAREISEKATSKNEFYFFYYLCILKMTAMRPGEVMTVEWKDYVDGHFNIRCTNTKESRYKRIWVHPVLGKLLDRLPRDSQFIIGVDNKTRNPETFRRIWKRIWQETGIKGVPYIIRASVATALLKENVPMAVVSKMLGHSTIEITAKHYAHVIEDDKKEAIKMLPKGFTDGENE